MADSQNTTPSRRAVLAGAATLPALAVPSIVQASNSPDPIFALIERHKTAYRREMECGRECFNTVDAPWAPEYDAAVHAAAEAADQSATEASQDAAFALTEIQPTTIAGVVALIEYVEAFNSGAFYLEPWSGSTLADWQSRPTV